MNCECSCIDLDVIYGQDYPSTLMNRMNDHVGGMVCCVIMIKQSKSEKYKWFYIPFLFLFYVSLCFSLSFLLSVQLCLQSPHRMFVTFFLSFSLSLPSPPISLFQFPVSSSLLSSHSRAADCSKPRKSSSSHSANTICIGFALSLN